MSSAIMRTKTMAKEQPHMERASQLTRLALARSCSITSSLPAAKVMHPSAASWAGTRCSSAVSGRMPMCAAITPPCGSRKPECYAPSHLRGGTLFGEVVAGVAVTSKYSVISGRRLNLLSLGPNLYSVMRSTASARYDSGARNFSGCNIECEGGETCMSASASEWRHAMLWRLERAVGFCTPLASLD